MQNCFYINGSVPPQGSKVMTKSVMRTVRGKSAVFALLQSDGAGNDGDTASYKLASLLKKSHDKLVSISPDRHDILMNDFLIDANGEMSSYASANRLSDYGAGAGVLTVNSGVATVTSVGGVSCYYYGGGNFKRLTEKKLASVAALGEKDALIGGEISGSKPHHSYSEKIDVEMDDVFLLCSAGVTDFVSDDTIAYILSLNLTDERTVQRIVSEAIAKNSDKDITVMLVRNGGKPIRSKRFIKAAILVSAAVVILAVLSALFSSLLGNLFKKPEILEEPSNTVITKPTEENEFIKREDPSDPIPPEPYHETVEEDEISEENPPQEEEVQTAGEEQ